MYTGRTDQHVYQHGNTYTPACASACGADGSVPEVAAGLLRHAHQRSHRRVATGVA